MNLAKHESEVNETLSPQLVSAPKKEKKFLTIQELIEKVKDFTIEVYGDAVHELTVEEIRDHQGSYGTKIQISFQLPARLSQSTDATSEPAYEKHKKEFTLNSKTGIIDCMRNLKS